MENKFVRPGNISEFTGGILSRTHALELERDDPKFPGRIRLSERCTGWCVDEITNYLKSFMEE
jgi:predicted DNA-binding transcriptional regulator AlpA